jgi:hypothetical protein
LVAVGTKDAAKLIIKKNKNYTSDLFPEEEHYQIYHVIESYPSVKRFIDKRSRGQREDCCGLPHQLNLSGKIPAVPLSVFHRHGIRKAEER